MSAEAAVWPALIAWKREVTGQNTVPLEPEDIAAIRAATIDRWTPKPVPAGPLTVNVALEIISHEAIVQEWYLDSQGIGTWSVGITNASGHDVNRYKDKPQSIKRCLEVFLWALKEEYIPKVEQAFAGYPLSEAQFAAALSFHYNTGKILKADWVTHWKGGSAAAARIAFMNWRKPLSIIPRRERERDLFFDGRWSNDGCATVYPVKKPSYHPDFAHPQRVDVRPCLQELLA